MKACFPGWSKLAEISIVHQIWCERFAWANHLGRWGCPSVEISAVAPNRKWSRRQRIDTSSFYFLSLCEKVAYIVWAGAAGGSAGFPALPSFCTISLFFPARPYHNNPLLALHSWPLTIFCPAPAERKGVCAHCVSSFGSRDFPLIWKE